MRRWQEFRMMQVHIRRPFGAAHANAVRRAEVYAEADVAITRRTAEHVHVSVWGSHITARLSPLGRYGLHFLAGNWAITSTVTTIRWQGWV